MKFFFQPGSLGGDRHVHHISSVSSTDAGSYSCVAENVLGQAQQVAYLAVSGQGGGGVGGVGEAYLAVSEQGRGGWCDGSDVIVQFS